MPMPRGLNAQLAAQFRHRLTLEVPQKLEAQAKRVYFDALSQLDEAVVEGTPVDTSYLVNSRGVSTDAVGPQPMPPRDPRAKAGAYADLGDAAASQVAGGFADAVRGLKPCTYGFQAEYAPFVELKRHMIVRAKARWGEIVEIAIANAAAINAARPPESAS